MSCILVRVFTLWCVLIVAYGAAYSGSVYVYRCVTHAVVSITSDGEKQATCALVQVVIIGLRVFLP